MSSSGERVRVMIGPSGAGVGRGVGERKLPGGRAVLVAVGGTSVKVTIGIFVGCGRGVLVSVGTDEVDERVMVGPGVAVRVGVGPR